MIVVIVELWPRGDGNKAKEIGRAYIGNVGGTADSGNYEVAVCRQGTTKCPFTGEVKAARTGSVENFPRRSYNMWRLIIRSLLSSFPEETNKR